MKYSDKTPKRVVIKVGTSTLAHETGRLNLRRMESLTRVISDLKNRGLEIVLVSSGAIGVGSGKLGLPSRPSDMPTKQAVAAVGQCELMYRYDKLFEEYNHTVAQVLLTRDVVDEKHRRENVINTFERLFALHALPIVNENDTVCVEEIESGGRFGDNDTLSALVSVLTKADLLILCSDIDGLYESDPHQNPDAGRFSCVGDLEAVKGLAGGSLSANGTGGMVTKLQAAEICMAEEIDMVILNGSNPELLYDLFDGKELAGTLFRKGADNRMESNH